MEKNQILIGGACVFKKHAGGYKWFLIKTSNNGWELPKAVVRKTESSVRAVIRMMGEQGGMRARVLEEAGRTSSVATNGGRTLPQRTIYYLMLHRADSGESIGFEESEWFEYQQAVGKISLKREKAVLRGAKDELKKWEKKRKLRRSLAQ